MPISAAFSTWRGAAEQLGQPRRRHRARRPDLALTAHLGARNRRVAPCTARRSPPPSEGIRTTPSSSAARQEPHVVVQHRGHDSRRAVRRRGHHPSTAGILLVDRQRIHRDPVHRVACGSPERPRSINGRANGRRRRTREPARQHSLGVQSRVDALAHRRPRSAAARPARRTRERTAHSLAPHHLPHRRPCSSAHSDELGSVPERYRTAPLRPGGSRRLHPRRRRIRRRPSSTSPHVCTRRQRNRPRTASRWCASPWLRRTHDDVRRVEGDRRDPAKPQRLAARRLPRPAHPASRVHGLGRRPSNPNKTAPSVPCPRPVAASDPYSSTRTRADVDDTRSPSSGRRTAPRRASAPPCENSTDRCRSRRGRRR